MPEFSSNAVGSKMMDKLFMQIMTTNGLLVGLRQFGTVVEVLDQKHLLVDVDQGAKEEKIRCNPHVPFNFGDRVLIEYINNDPKDRYVMASLGSNLDIEVIDYSALPTEPVEIFRNEQGQAYKFKYGYDKKETTWWQELIRNEKNQVVDVIHTYPDGFVMSRSLYRDERDRVYKYE